MRPLISLLAALVLAWPCSANPLLMLAGSPPVSSEPDATTTSIPHDEFLDGFQNPTTGYENTWTEVGTTANIGKPSDTTALTSGKPTGAENRALKIVQPTDGTETYVYWDRGSAISRGTTNLDVTFYVYVPSGSYNSGTDAGLFVVANGSGAFAVSLSVAWVSASTYRIYTGAATVTVNADTWNKVEVHLNTTAASSYFDVNDTGNQTFTRANNDYQRIFLGATAGLGTSETYTAYFDLVCWDTP